MKTVVWRSTESAAAQLESWCELAGELGLLHAVFDESVESDDLSWKEIEPWTHTRAVTLAEVRSSLSLPTLDIALCSDLVYLQPEVELRLSQGEPSVGLLWALGRAGRAALARGLLDPSPMTAGEAVRLGLAQGLLEPGEPPPVSDVASTVALTTARDLMRAATGARSKIELASFRLLFTAGDPAEGAMAFLENRDPEFDSPAD